ncbi:MAG TPA: hypothetical protein VN844_26325 [Pyrinomonadaceae bacterium]|nr:hypothetical protein [Pyrinomonadaceae bacterium]
MRGMDWTQISLASIITFIVTWLARPYFGSYLNKKGENRALHEDLDKIHRQLERIKSEFSLKLDFYKVVYPEKVKAALDLHNLAAKLFMDIPAYYVGAQERQRAMELEADAGVMLWRAKSYEFLLGEEVVRLTREYRMICITVFLMEREFRSREVPPVSHGDIWAHEASYKELSNALRKILHLDTLDGLMSSFSTGADNQTLVQSLQSRHKD